MIRIQERIAPIEITQSPTGTSENNRPTESDSPPNPMEEIPVIVPTKQQSPVISSAHHSTNEQPKEEYVDMAHEQEEINDQQERSENHGRNHELQSDPVDQHDEAEQNRKERNRKRTLKQRERHYRYEIIRRGIDSRFTITMVKEILRRFDVPYTAINISKSKITRRTSLYIGIRNPSKLREYEARTKDLFTTDFYNEFRARHHL